MSTTDNRETLRAVIDCFKLWECGDDADGYNVSADRLAALMANHTPTTKYYFDENGKPTQAEWEVSPTAADHPITGQKLRKALNILKTEAIAAGRNGVVAAYAAALNLPDESMTRFAQAFTKAASESASPRDELVMLKEAGREFLEAAEAVFDWMNGNDLSADHSEQKPEDFERVSEALVKFRALLAA